jgi:hypothetical protein
MQFLLQIFGELCVSGSQRYRCRQARSKLLRESWPETTASGI